MSTFASAPTINAAEWMAVMQGKSGERARSEEETTSSPVCSGHREQLRDASPWLSAYEHAVAEYVQLIASAAELRALCDPVRSRR